MNYENRLNDLKSKNDYESILRLCDEVLKDEAPIITIAEPRWLCEKCQALDALERWEELADLCRERLRLAKERRNLYERYDTGKITKDEKVAFLFLIGLQSDLWNLAWSNTYRRLDNEERDSTETLERALSALCKRS